MYIFTIVYKLELKYVYDLFNYYLFYYGNKSSTQERNHKYIKLYMLF